MDAHEQAALSELEREIGFRLERLPVFSGDFSPNGYFSEGDRVLGIALCKIKLDMVPKSLLLFEDLTSLILNENDLTDINIVGELKNLQHLSLSENKIIDISALSRLPTLTSINLSHNAITDLTSLRSLVKLESCDISFNKFTNIEPLQYLTKLQRLILWENSVAEMKYISQLESLVILDLCDTLLTDISFLAELTNLIDLDIRNNEVREISALVKLKKLKKLHLWHNEISDITPLKSLKHLTELDINSNRVNDITPLEKLDNLKLLNLADNKISIFPEWLTTKKLENYYGASISGFDSGYNVTRNPITNVPLELLRQDNGAIADYFLSLKNGAQPINEIKVILLGEGAAGKTSLMNYFQNRPFNKQQSQTHGINLAEFIQDSGVTLKMWDFGGQDIMHHTHQFFLTQKSVYVLVLNARENTDTEKWLKLIQVFGGESPIIIVTNKIDENPSDHENIKYLNTKYENLKGRYVRVSCETGVGLSELKALLSETIKELLHVRTLWGNSWLGVKKDLEAMRNGDILKDYIHFDIYDELCEKHSVSKSHRETLITWLHQLGVITYFPDPNLNETNVINPSWLTEGFYAIINAKEIADNFGRFNIDQLSEILDVSRYPKHKFNFLVGLMIKFELCYRIDDHNFLIPDLLNKEEPEFSFNTSTSLKFKIKYANLLPKAILPKFMVRRHQEIKNELKWRTGLVIKDRNFESEALIRVDEDDKEISLYVKGQEKRGYLASIISNFENISMLYEGLEYEKLIPCICSDCKSDHKPFFFKYDVLQKSRERGRKTYPCEVSDKDVSIDELLGILITREDLEKEIKKLLGKASTKTKKHIEDRNIEGLIETLKSLFSSVSYLLFEKSEKAYHTPLFILLRSIFGDNVRADEIQAKGRADIIIDLESIIYIVELKLDGSSTEALGQIHQNKYYEPYLTEEKEIILLGINFSSKIRNIESFVSENLKTPAIP